MNPITKVHSVLNQIEQIADEFAKKNNIEHLAGPQGHALLYLAKHKEDEIFVKDIENHLNISKSVASNLVKRMERNGFITVIPSKEDKRYKQVILTECGKQKVKPLEGFHEDMKKYLFKDISFEDLKTMDRVTKQLELNILKYKGEKDA